MPSEPYLIAHLVRGEPAFDIAERASFGINDETGEEEEYWIIPTSGHRAYPYWSVELCNIDYRHILDLTGQYTADYTEEYCPPTCPPGWPDHYSGNAAPKGQGLITNLAERLGLVKRPTVSRR